MWVRVQARRGSLLPAERQRRLRRRRRRESISARLVLRHELIATDVPRRPAHHRRVLLRTELPVGVDGGAMTVPEYISGEAHGFRGEALHLDCMKANAGESELEQIGDRVKPARSFSSLQTSPRRCASRYKRASISTSREWTRSALSSALSAADARSSAARCICRRARRQATPRPIPRWAACAPRCGASDPRADCRGGTTTP